MRARESVKLKNVNPEPSEFSVFDRPKTKHEQFLSFAFNILSSSDISLYIKQRTIEILKNIPDDAFEDTQQRAILDLLRAGSEYALTDIEKFLDYVVVQGPLEKYEQGKLKPHYLAYVYYLENTPFFELYKRIGLEILEEWKRKKRENLFEIFKHLKKLTYEDLLKLAQEVHSIENYQLFVEDSLENAQQNFLNKAAKPEDFDFDFEWLYPNFIAKGTINLYVAPPAQGKSALALALGLHLLEKGAIDKLLYFDADNPVSVHVQRRIHELVQKYQNKLFYFKGREVETAQKFQKLFLESSVVQGKVLVVIDTLRAFVGAQDINKGEIAEKIMSLFKKYLMDGEKTIIILHHVNKALPQDERALRDRVKGATEFLDRADVAYFLEKKDESPNSITTALVNIKPRIPTKNRLGFTINFDTWSLKEEEEPLSAEEKNFVNTVREIIYTYQQTRARNPNKSQIINELMARGWGRNQSLKLLDKFTRKFWYVSYDKLFNQIVYKIKNEETGNSGKLGELENLETTRPEGESLDNSDFSSFPSSPPFPSFPLDLNPENLDELMENAQVEDAKEQFLRATIQKYVDEYHRRNQQYPTLDQVLAWCYFQGIEKDEVRMYLTFSRYFKLTPDKRKPKLIIVHPAHLSNPPPLHSFTTFLSDKKT
ncbi:MAG: AAA family ATPase [candidate division WOR-3 bacterium]